MPAPVVLAALGALLVSLDSSLNIALPAIATTFGVGPSGVRWMIICYVVTYALTAFAAGILADRVGARKVFIAGLWFSGVVFAGYWAAPSFAAVLALRVAQGLGGGFIYGTAPALVTQALPRERHGRGLGVMSLGLGTGLSIGPAIGGLAVDVLSWRAVFLFRAPLAIALAVLATAALGRASRGGAAPRMLAPRDLARASVLRSAALAFLANYAQFSIWLLIPFYLVSVRSLTASVGALFFTLTPFGTAVAAPLAGWAADRIGARWPAVAGLALEAAGLLIVSRLGDTSPLEWVIAGLALVGLGVGIFQVSNLAEMMTAFPRAQQGAAGGLAFLSRTLGSAAGVAVSAALFDARLATSGAITAAFQWAFFGAAMVAALGVLIALVPALSPAREGSAAL